MSLLTQLRIKDVRFADEGATVSDWLGTAALHATSAARACDQAREANESSDASYYIDNALQFAKQAVEELQQIRDATSA